MLRSYDEVKLTSDNLLHMSISLSLQAAPFPYEGQRFLTIKCKALSKRYCSNQGNNVTSRLVLALAPDRFFCADTCVETVLFARGGCHVAPNHYTCRTTSECSFNLDFFCVNLFCVFDLFVSLIRTHLTSYEPCRLVNLHVTLSTVTCHLWVTKPCKTGVEPGLLTPAPATACAALAQAWSQVTITSHHMTNSKLSRASLFSCATPYYRRSGHPLNKDRLIRDPEHTLFLYTYLYNAITS